MGMMNRENIIDGLRFTAGMVTFNPLDGETITPEELNEQDKLTYDACMGAIDLLKAQEPVQLGELIEGFDNVLEFYSCGFCGNAVRKPWVYCPFCGKVVKWDE